MNPGRAWHAILDEHQRVVELLREATPTLTAVADACLGALRDGRRLLIFGNGGSAADAQHFATELTGRFKTNRRALPAIALTTDTSALTAIGNDFGFEQVFARQIEALAQPGDVAISLSTSGNSPNILAAARAARARGARVIGFTGATGGQLAPLCDICLRIPHASSDRIQEGHAIAYHYICERVDGEFS